MIIGSLTNTQKDDKSYNAFGRDVVYGVSFNNNPSVQDLWNTTPAWGFPFSSSPMARTPGAAPLIGDLGGIVGGATLYAMIDNLLYLEAGAYASFAQDAQHGMGHFDSRKIDGSAPYWRVALQKDFNGHYVALGHFGMRADVIPDVSVNGSRADRFSDLGVDATYQYMVNPDHIVELKGAYIRESQDFRETGALHPSNRLDTFRINAAYTFEQTYGLTFGYNRTWSAKSDAELLPPDDGFDNGRPTSEFFTTEVSYTPFGKQASFSGSWLNLRFAAQYVAYTKFNGGDRNYDAAGRNASDNNTLYFNTWLSF